MADIVDLDAQRPHYTGPAVCLRCGHEWISVRPLGVVALECPKCGAERGYNFSNILGAIGPELGQECCGQVDQDGVCAAPACIHGSAANLVRACVTLAHLEMGGHPQNPSDGSDNQLSS